MRLQSDRKLAVGLLDAHEKRFEQMALMPGIASKYRRCGALDMAKSLPRAGLMVSVSSPQYDVNKETIIMKSSIFNDQIFNIQIASISVYRY